MKKEKLLLFDTNSIIHRAFHALPPLKSKDGKPSGAVYGTLLAFFKIISEINPKYVAAAFDSPGKTFRHKKYKDYKANRVKAPEDLISQIIRTQDVFFNMGVVVLRKDGLEADDIVGAVSASAPKNIETVIVTGDMDILQLVNEKTKVYTLKRGVQESILYDIEKVKERYDGLFPSQIVDIKALQGDVSDNIPGVEGIGEKTAIKLIKEFKNIEELYKNLEETSSLSVKLKEKLFKEKEKAFLSKYLATIDKKGFSDFDFDDFNYSIKSEKTKDVLDDLGFMTIKKRFFKEEEKNLKLF
jgi:DNA polymerase I